MRFEFPALALALLLALALSACVEQPAGNTAGNGTGDTVLPDVQFRSPTPKEYSREQICSSTCEDSGYEHWAVQMDVNSGRYLCLCTKEVCRDEEGATSVTRYCTDVGYAFYFSE